MEFLNTFLNWNVLMQASPLLLKGLGLTISLGITSLLISFVLGMVLVLIRLYSLLPFRIFATIYIDVFRAVPLLVLLVLIYYALPFVGLRLSSYWAAAVSLSMVASAYMAETFRAGIEAVHKGQFEAAQALGLSWTQMMKDIILPQALKLVVPPSTGLAISLIKDTALASVVAMPDLLKQATQAQAFYANPSPLVGAAILYIVLLLPLVRVVSWLEGRQKRAAH